MEGAIVIKVDMDDNTETAEPVAQTTSSPDEDSSNSSNGVSTKPTDTSGRKSPDTPGSDTPTNNSLLSEGENNGEVNESVKKKSKALALLGIDEDEESKVS